MKLVCRAMQIGLPEKDIMSLLDDENIADFDLENLKSRIQIKQTELASTTEKALTESDMASIN